MSVIDELKELEARREGDYWGFPELDESHGTDYRRLALEVALEVERGFSRLEAYGVPQERARTIANGIEVLKSRMAKLQNATHFELSMLRIAGEKLIALMDEVGYPDGEESDRVFSQRDFSGLRTVLSNLGEMDISEEAIARASVIFSPSDPRLVVGQDYEASNTVTFTNSWITQLTEIDVDHPIPFAGLVVRPLLFGHAPREVQQRSLFLRELPKEERGE